MSIISIPPAFAAGVIAERGEQGAQWLQALQSKIKSYCALWRLEIEGEPWHGYLGLVLPVRHGDELCALKLTWVDEESRHEALALQLWAGNGAVRLLEADAEQGVLLLERLNASSSLAQVDIDEAVAVAGRLLRGLAIPAPDGLPLLRDYARRQGTTLHQLWKGLGCPFPEQYVVSAQCSAQELGPSARNLLVNQDLHYENVLAGTREPWLVIDPKVISGDVEFGVAPLLWNRLDKHARAAELSHRFEMLVNIAGLDRNRARGWTLVRCVDYWLWALAVRLTEDPAKCRIIIEWLLNSHAGSSSY